MENPKLQVYQGIIRYLLESTQYTINHIADLTNTKEKSIRSIFYDGLIPSNFKSELQLVKLFSIILDINSKQKNASDDFQNNFSKSKTRLIAI